MKACGNPECEISTGIHDGLTFGSGQLDGNGYWEKPCAICAREWEKRHPEDGECWPFETTPVTDNDLYRDLGELSEHPLVKGFQTFHQENPHVYRQLRSLALKAKRAGRVRYGMKGLFEVLRWHAMLKTSDDEFKLNNNYTAFYSRLLMQRERELMGFFETRKSQADAGI